MQLAEFGISRVEEVAQGLSPTGEFHCQCEYMAKELLDGDSYTNKIDVWSTGCVLFEMANLKGMWHKVVPHEHRVFPQAILDHIIWDKVSSAIESRSHEPFDEDCPKEIKEMILKATCNDPNERPTAQELYDQAKAIQSRM